MTATLSLDEIPGPRGLPVLGNIRDIDADAPFESLMRLADEFGPIYKLTTPSGTRLIVTGPEFKQHGVSAGVRTLTFDELPRGGLDPHRDMDGAVTWQFSTSGTTLRAANTGPGWARMDGRLASKSSSLSNANARG